MDQVTETASNEQMIQSQLIERGIVDPRVLDAMRNVPRERFFPEDRREDVFADRASSIGHGQTISQPYIVALMTEKLNLTGSERVLGDRYRQRISDRHPQPAGARSIFRRAYQAVAGWRIRAADGSRLPQCA